MAEYNAELADIREHLQKLSTEQAKMGERIDGALKRIDEQKQLADSVHTLALSVRDLTNAQKNTSDAVKTLRDEMDELKGKPAKRWESVIGSVLGALVGGIIAYFLWATGLKK
ncbi:MAG: hypothetical protein PHI27_06435 [Eubacteriales bacterium]|nr:hypothetical protein [Eubacteriales bacterium]MDD3881872.1 hypothetical protein [Eubacteriales bacterium]MDD4512883.1 hypothetical protein [Eubacteriales bacterium]